MAETQTLPALVRAKYPGQYDDLSDADLDTKVRSKFPGVYDDIPKPAESAKPSAHSTSTGLALASAGKAVPLTATLAMEAATHPGVPRAMSTVGQIVGGIEGFRREGPLGAAAGAWTGGKAGWFTGKLAQKIGAPVAAAMDKLAPYAQTLSTLGAVQGGLDLAQMAEPKREDIGFLGIGHSSNGGTDLRAPQSQLRAVQYLIDRGASPSAAVKQVTGGIPQLMGPLMGLYMRSKAIK